jgi:hypothetical protein
LVNHAVSQLELGRLGTRRKLLASGLLDDAGTGKADDGTGFGDDAVSECCETGSHPPEGRVGEDRNEGKPGGTKGLNSGGGLGHLDQGHDTFLLSGASRRGDDDDGPAFSDAEFECPSDLLADDGTQGAGEIAHVEDCQGDR